MMTEAVWWLLLVQVVLGGYDTFYHHEFTQRLAWRRSQRTELKLHALRNGFYLLLFLSFAWLDLHGMWALLLLLLLVAEAILTMIDFVEEDRSRKLPATERVTHGVITINYGAVLALLLPLLWQRVANASELVWVSYGLWSVWATMMGLAIGGLGIRDWLAAARLGKLQDAPPAPLVAPLIPGSRYLVTGGTGFVGSRLVESLVAAGHDVTVLTRQVENATHLPAPLRVVTDLDQIGCHEEFDAVINLAGEAIANGLWTRRKQRRIVDSRLSITRALVGLIARLERKPAVFVSGSAVGWYGLRDDQVLTETAVATDCFSHRLCQQWEAAALPAGQYGTRVVLLRTGLVLGREGGLLAQLLTPFEFGVGGPVGDGRHYMPWVELDDLVRLIAFVIATPTLDGPVNATAPTPVDNNHFSNELGRALRRPAIFRLPAAPLRYFGGQMASELLLGGQNAIPRKLLDAGFEFDQPVLGDALRRIVGRPPPPLSPTLHHGFFIQ